MVDVGVAGQDGSGHGRVTVVLGSQKHCGSWQPLGGPGHGGVGSTVVAVQVHFVDDEQ